MARAIHDSLMRAAQHCTHIAEMTTPALHRVAAALPQPSSASQAAAALAATEPTATATAATETSARQQCIRCLMSVVQLHKRHMATTTGSQAVDDLPGRTDSYYWVPPVEEQTFTFDRRTIADRRATGKLESALEAVLFSDGFLRDQLVNKYGFCMHRVRLAKDRRTVFILWDANPGKAQACQQALERNAFRLRRDLAKVLRSKHTPYLEFRHDHLPPMQAAAAAALEAAERELAAMAAAAAGTAAGAQAPNMAETQQGSGPSRVNAGGQGDGTFDDNSAAPAFDTKQPSSGNSSLGQHDIDAAIRRLEDITRERQHRG